MNKQIVSELANFAERRSNLLIQEARLWQDVSEWAARFEIVDKVKARPDEHAKTPGNESSSTLSPQHAAEFLGLSKQTLAKLRVYGGGA